MPTKGEKTAARILDAAEKLFAKRGYQATTLRDIADLVPLKQPSLYNHFPTKQAMYEAVLDRALTPVFEALNTALASGVTVAPESLPLAMMDLFSTRPAISSLLFREMIESEEPNVGARRWIRRMTKTALSLPNFEGDPTVEFARLLANVNLIVGFFAVGPGLVKQSGVKLSRKELEQAYRALIEGMAPAQEEVVDQRKRKASEEAAR